VRGTLKELYAGFGYKMSRFLYILTNAQNRQKSAYWDKSDKEEREAEGKGWQKGIKKCFY
jgi:hypothetical protein